MSSRYRNNNNERGRDYNPNRFRRNVRFENNNRGHGNKNNNKFGKNVNKKNDINNTEDQHGITYEYMEPKQYKDFKINLGGESTEKVKIPIFNDQARNETMFLLIHRFNQMIDDGDLFREETGEDNQMERDIEDMSEDEKAWKLTKIKHVYRLFRSCLQDRARDEWENLLDESEAPDLPCNYDDEDHNVMGVEAFFDHQRMLVSKIFELELIENTKAYMMNTNKPRNMTVEKYVRRVQTINNYIPWMDIGAVPLTERELIRSVLMRKIPSSWRSSLLRSGNNNINNIKELISKLIPIETDERENGIKKQNKDRNRGIPNNRHRGRRNNWNNNREDKYGRNGDNKEKEHGDRGRRDRRENNQQRRDMSDDSYDSLHRRNNDREQRRESLVNERQMLLTYRQPSVNDDSSIEEDIIPEENTLNGTTGINDEFNNNDEENSKWIIKEPQCKKVTWSPNITSNKKGTDKENSPTKEANPLIAKERGERKSRTATMRTTIKFTLPNEDGRDVEYLGLLDTGSTHNLISKDLVTRHKLVTKKDNGIWSTNNGNFATNKLAVARDISLPQFTTKRRIKSAELSINPNQGQRYKAIFGMSFLLENGIDFILSKGEIQWQGIGIKLDDCQEEIDNKGLNEQRKGELKENKYKKYSAKEITNHTNQKHLTSKQKELLEGILTKFENIFEGRPGTFRDLEVSFDLKENIKPFYGRPYPVPEAHKKIFKGALDEMIENGILEKTYEDTDWASPTFGVPKKNNAIRIVSDFRRLNQAIKRSPWPIPTIMELLHTCGGLTYATAIDQIMGYWSITMARKIRELLTIITPFGKYIYKKLPMGLKISADVFQREMCKLMDGIEGVLIYIDDLLIITKGSFEEHILVVEQVLEKMQRKDLQINIDKSHFAVKEVEYLGYILTTEGIKPQPQKVEAILNINQPKTVKELRGFIGLVNFYRDLFRGRAHYLAPMTELLKGVKRGPIKWTDEAIAAFHKVKEIAAKDALLHFPDFNKKFVIYTDSSDYQLGAIISQEGRVIAYWSKKMTETQRRYGTIEQELLTITEILKAYRNMLLGMKILIFTDHENLTYIDVKYDNQRVMRQRLYIEEFGPEICHIEGKDNIAADTLSRNPSSPNNHHLLQEETLKEITREIFANEKYIVPIDYQTIKEEQDRDEELRTLLASEANTSFKLKRYGRVEVYVKQGKDERWRIFVPTGLRQKLIEWYKYQLMHPGTLRMIETIRKHFTWPKMTQEIKEYTEKCSICQLNKTTNNPRAGKLPLRDPHSIEPFQLLTVDLCGPWQMRAVITEEIKSNRKKIARDRIVKIQILCLTMIDEACGWPEIIPIVNKQSKNIAELVDSEWFCRYPRPEFCIHDNGKEFIGNEFEELLQSYGVISQPTTVKNPRGNAVHERAHLLMAELLRTEEELYVPVGSTIGREIRKLIQRVAFALRSTVSSMTTYAPGHLVFNRDMIVHQKELINWNKIYERRRRQQIKDNEKENKGRTNHEYTVGENVVILTRTNERTGKLLDFKHEGPYCITKIYNNGTVKIQRNNFEEIINIRRIKPYKT